MSRALVLGGGGPVGIGWESGLIAGLDRAGVRLADADLVVGTSAGSVVGAALGLGLDPAEALAAVTGGGPDGAGGSSPGADVDGAALASFMEALGRAATSGASPEAARAEIGQMALHAATVPEEAFVGLFAMLEGAPWPDRFACTAVEVESGELRRWDAGAGAPLHLAVASSCAVPGIFPPVTVDGRRYMDGGVRTALNADLAAGFDAVVAVSCFALALPPGMEDPVFAALAAQLEAELAAVRAAGALEVVEPNAEFLELSGWGLALMDFTKSQAAFDVGIRQAAEVAGRVSALWTA